MFFGLPAEDKCRTPPQIYLNSLFPDHVVLLSRNYMVVGRAISWLLYVFRAFEGLVLGLSAGQTAPKFFV